MVSAGLAARQPRCSERERSVIRPRSERATLGAGALGQCTSIVGATVKGQRKKSMCLDLQVLAPMLLVSLSLFLGAAQPGCQALLCQKKQNDWAVGGLQDGRHLVQAWQCMEQQGAEGRVFAPET